MMCDPDGSVTMVRSADRKLGIEGPCQSLAKIDKGAGLSFVIPPHLSGRVRWHRVVVIVVVSVNYYECPSQSILLHFNFYKVSN